MLIKELETSQFHPLDHWPFTARCRSLPGGSRSHLSLAWTYRRRDQVVGPYLRLTRCHFGRHQWVTWWGWDEQTGLPKPRPECRYCDTARLPTEAERLTPFP